MTDAAPANRSEGSELPELGRVADIVEIGNRYYVLASSSLADERDQVLKHQDSFALFDRYGDIKPVGLGEEGVYHEGTRHLSSLLLRIGTERPLLLGSTAKRDNSRLSIDLTNPDMMLDGERLGHGTVHIARSKVLWDGICYERVTVRNFGLGTTRLQMVLTFGADFADIFEVRGMRRRERGERLPPRTERERVTLAYDGLDGVQRRTRIGFAPTPSELTATSAVYELELEPGRATSIDVTVACDNEQRRTRSIRFEPALRRSSRLSRDAHRAGTRFKSSNELCNEWLNRSLADLVMMTTQTEHGPYPYAGVPWFSTVFGRDALIVGRQMLWVLPDLAKGVLSYLAAWQADDEDPANDAQPGKILHEMRHGEMAGTGEIPFGRYYGSHDATPLFAGLAADYVRHTGDLAFGRGIWPNVERALAWMDGPGDPDGDGFLEYERRTPSGLIHQGWKDSHDGTFHADGSLADGPIALSEIQAYAYAARVGTAQLAEALELPERAAELRAQAENLRRRFEDAFWLDDLGTYALALDGDKRPTRVRTSNAGHCLASGIVARDRAARVAETLMDDASFSGWGVRTVSAGESRYNPMSYHNGSIWPHDSAMVAMGLGRYGHHDAAARILTGLFEASRHFDLMRLPELFCGFTRRAGEAPTLYPVACSPQSWAAGAPFMLLQACLGLEVDAQARTVRLSHARLPLFLDHLTIENLAVGDARIDLHLERQRTGVGLNILDRTGDVEVMTLK
jgi:glycogen debranching enzyme